MYSTLLSPVIYKQSLGIIISPFIPIFKYIIQCNVTLALCLAHQPYNADSKTQHDHSTYSSWVIRCTNASFRESGGGT